jgi:hypothetical protein
MEKMTEMVSKDNSKGVTTAANNQQYGGFVKKGEVAEAKSRHAGAPSKGNNVSIKVEVDFHSHPSGTKKVNLPGGGTATAQWIQPHQEQILKPLQVKTMFLQ